MSGEYVVTSVTTEILTDGSPSARLSGLAAEVLHSGNPQTAARTSSLAAEVLVSTREREPPAPRRIHITNVN